MLEYLVGSVVTLLSVCAGAAVFYVAQNGMPKRSPKVVPVAPHPTVVVGRVSRPEEKGDVVATHEAMDDDRPSYRPPPPAQRKPVPPPPSDPYGGGTDEERSAAFYKLLAERQRHDEFGSDAVGWLEA